MCNMDINEHAPAIAKAEIRVQAPLETVWRIQCDIDRWSEWNPDIQRSKLEGPLSTGSVFRWKSGGAAIVSTLREIEPMRKIAWTGKAIGIRAAHSWSFERQGDSVAVVTRESFDGWLPHIFPRTLRKMLDRSLRTWLQNLKRRAEIGDPSRSPPSAE